MHSVTFQIQSTPQSPSRALQVSQNKHLNLKDEYVLHVDRLSTTLSGGHKLQPSSKKYYIQFLKNFIAILQDRSEIIFFY